MGHFWTRKKQEKWELKAFLCIFQCENGPRVSGNIFGGKQFSVQVFGGGYHLEVRGGGGADCRGEPFH